MQSMEALHIDLSRITQSALRSEIKLNDAFFAALEQDEIKGGDVTVSLSVKAAAGDIYKVNVAVNGCVTVECDRCLDDLTIAVEAEDAFNIKDGDFDEADAADLRYLEGAGMTYDVTWDVYEIIATALPLQRCHEDGLCNEDVASRIAGVVGDDVAEEED